MDIERHLEQGLHGELDILIRSRFLDLCAAAYQQQVAGVC